MMKMKKRLIPKLKREFVFYPRQFLKRRAPDVTFQSPQARARPGAVPTPPPSWDWTKAGTLQFPILGNDSYGDCEYAAACHGSMSQTGMAMTEDAFSPDDVVKAYLQLAGGDNGLDTSTMLAAWQHGLVGGPHKILGFMAVNPNDAYAMQLAGWLFGGIFFTLAVPEKWIMDAAPGAVWDAGPGVRPNPDNGHAIWFDSRDGGGKFGLETWGIEPQIRITQAGVNLCDPEADVVFSLDWFNAQGVAPNGLTYDQLSALWIQLGGRTLPPNPFTPPPTPPGPTLIPPPLGLAALTVVDPLESGTYDVIARSQRLTDLCNHLQISPQEAQVITLQILEGISTMLPIDKARALARDMVSFPLSAGQGPAKYV
jgi:hypothetical protein